MYAFHFSVVRGCAVFGCAFMLLGCSPKYDWREVHGADIPFTVVLPAKPSVRARPVDLDGVQVTMTMMAAEAENTTFAVGTAELPDAAQAQRALQSMKTALARNIGGTIRREKVGAADGTTTIELETTGAGRLLVGHLVARGTRVYQVLAVGEEKVVARDAVETFLSSFRPE